MAIFAGVVRFGRVHLVCLVVVMPTSSVVGHGDTRVEENAALCGRILILPVDELVCLSTHLSLNSVGFNNVGFIWLGQC